jgi:hypothetical protein
VRVVTVAVIGKVVGVVTPLLEYSL